MEIKLCKDCKWSEFNFGWTCKNPKLTGDIDLVTGQVDNYCANARHLGNCGTEGKLWEAKDGNA